MKKTKTSAKTRTSRFTPYLPPHWLLLTLILVILLRLPSLFEPFRYADENIYLTLGHALRKGLIFYRDIHDNKPPLLYLLAALAGNVFWFRFLLLVSSLLTVYFFHRLARLIFSQNKAVQFATLFFAIISSIPLLEGNIANAEIFMICPIIIAFYLTLSGKAWWRPFTAGLLFALAILFKVPALFDAVALFLLWILDLKFNRPSSWKSYLKKNFLFATGLFLPLLATFIYYAAQGALPQYFTAAFFQNVGYLSSWRSPALPASLWAGNSPLLSRTALAALISLILLFLSRKRILSSSVSLILLWLTWSTFAVFLSERPYPHYLIQVLPPLSLALAWLIFNKSPKKLLSLPLFALLLAGLIHFNFYYDLTYPYYANFIKMATGKITHDQYLASFGSQYPSRYQLASFITTTTHPNDKIFVWGTDPEIYALTRRLPVGRYTVSYHIFDFHAQTETLTTLRQQMPKYIIITQTETRPWPEFFQFVTAHYLPLRTFEDATLYWHPSHSTNSTLSL